MAPTSMHVCNPYCGRCKPSKEPLLVCPECGVDNNPELGEHTNCKNCGTKLPPRKIPEPILCLRIDQICARPCGLGSIIPRIKTKTCTHHTPSSDTQLF